MFSENEALLLEAVRKLMQCPDLNVESLEPSTVDVIDQARQVYEKVAGQSPYSPEPLPIDSKTFVVEVYELYTQKIRVEASDIPEAVRKAHRSEGTWLDNSLELQETFPDTFGMPTEEISGEDENALAAAGFLEDDIIAGIKSIEEE